MQIHFLAATKGGRELYDTYKKIISILGQYGTVHGKHLSDPNLTAHGETALSSENIFARELAEIEQADIVVAEVTTPSLGVGYLISQAVSKQKNVICLYKGNNTDKLSAIIKGNEKIKIFTYESRDNLKNIFEENLK